MSQGHVTLVLRDDGPQGWGPGLLLATRLEAS